MRSYLVSLTTAWAAFSGAFAAALAVVATFNRQAPPHVLGGIAAGAVFGVVFGLTVAASTGLVLRYLVRRRVTAASTAALVFILAPVHVVALWLVTRESHETWATFIGAFPRGEWALFVPACAAGILAFIWRERSGYVAQQRFAG